MPERILIAAARGSHRALRKTQQVWERGGPLTSIVVKGVLFSLLLFYVQGTGFATWPTLLFSAVALISYFQPIMKRFTFGTSLILLIALALLVTSRFTITLPVQLHAGTLGQLIFAAAFGFLFAILLGIKNIVLVRRRQWYTILFIAQVYSICLLFFTTLNPIPSWRGMLVMAACIYMLLREYWQAQDHSPSRALTVTTLAISLLSIEMAWVICLLPLGFSKAASLLTLTIIMAAGIVDRYVRGNLHARFLRNSLLLFLALVVIMFYSVRWTI
jgi:hypothetical protein